MKQNIIKNILIFCTVLGLFSVTVIYAQVDDEATATISARVVDETGQAIPDVFVRSFLTNDKVITDSDGNFTLTVGAEETDHIVIDADGYEFKVTEISEGGFAGESIVLNRIWKTDGKNDVFLPYQDTRNDRSVSSTNMISGEELASYPSASLLEALSGRLPGLVIVPAETTPGAEEYTAYIRGMPATIYIDGIKRDPKGLSVNEVESVEVIKDLSGRAALGISGAGPILWITTKTGKSYKREIGVTAEKGISTPTVLPKYLDAYQYATLFNEALDNDGLTPLYSQEALDAYQSGSDPLLYPNIDYYDRYVNPSAPFQKASITFSGGDQRVNYFSMLDYVGSRGFESMGEQTTSDRYKIRGNVNINLTDYIQMNVNLSGNYGKIRYPNVGNGASPFDMFAYILSQYPSNALAVNYKDTLLISDNYTTNIENELKSSGYAQGFDLNTKNTATLLIDLNDLLEGLRFKATASFDVYNNITNSKGGTAALYRVLADRSLERIVEEAIDPDLTQGYNNFVKRTVGFGQFDYNRSFGESNLTMLLSYYQGYEEARTTGEIYQPLKMQDLSLRANYALSGKYILQLDLSYSGSMKLPEGERFGIYPTLGAAWVVSEESFLSESSTVDYLKLYTSFGVIGVDNFTLSGYNTYYLDQTLWENVGTWSTGIPGRTASGFNVYNIQQAGSDNFKLPKRNYFSIGTHGDILNRALAFEINYFYQKDYDLISQKASQVPSVYGGITNIPGTNLYSGTGFLPAGNYGEYTLWGFDGLLMYSGQAGNFHYSVGGNATYTRGKYLVVDEPLTLEEYRKLANKDLDAFWGYEAEGLYQTEDEITNRNVQQSWGSVQPGDIRYADYNDDGVVDEKDIYTTGAHSPRLYYGLNISLRYRDIGLDIYGQGRANGEILLSNMSYFWINSTSQNYSELMLDRWPETNEYPRLTTVSDNNYQQSTYWLASGAYLRLKNVQLSYTLPKKWSRNLLMREFRIFARGTNLLVLSELNKYSIDPELTWAGIYGYPVFRTITFGLSCKF